MRTRAAIPSRSLRWTAKSVAQIAGALREMGDDAHFTSVAAFMRLLGATRCRPT